MLEQDKKKEVSKVAVVMPAYNASRYIGRAIESVLSQLFTDFELIVVDDCSTDDTWQIISAYSMTDTRVKTFRLGQNTGSAKYPREYAISKSTSDWICWIDADDYVGVDYLANLMDRQASTNSDLVCSKMVAFDETGNVLYTLPAAEFDYTQIMTGKEAVMHTIGTFWKISVNGFLVRANIWENTSLYLNKDIVHMNVDDYSSREMLLKSSTVSFTKEPYFYRVYPESITKNVSVKLFEPLITDKMVIKLFMENFGDVKQLYLAYEQMINRVIGLMRNYIELKSKFSTSELTKINILLRNSFDYVSKLNLGNISISAKRRILFCFPFALSFGIMKLMYKKI